ncbi:MAG TPA: SRPBCC family protein [Gemmatimonadaceae bacterium]
MTSTDRIEKTVVLRAPRTRVWRAIANSSEFGQWFRVKFDGDFSVGKTISGKIQIPGFDHVPMEMHIESIEPESYFSYRWHPYAIEAGVDYSKEPTTLVEFRLEDAAEGTRLTILESGFDKIPAGRRAEAFRMNDNGWTSQAKAIEKYVSAS